MITAFAFVVAANIDRPAHAEAGRRWNRHEGLAWGTMIVNVLGSFALGLLHDVGPPTITVVGSRGTRCVHNVFELRPRCCGTGRPRVSSHSALRTSPFHA